MAKRQTTGRDITLVVLKAKEENDGKTKQI